MKFRKCLTLLLLFVLCMQMMAIPANAASTPTIRIYLDGKQIQSDVPPYMIPKGVTLVPVRVVSEAIGAEVTWLEKTKTVNIKKSDTAITLTVNKKAASVNGSLIELEEAAQMKQGRVMVPLRFVSEQLGLLVGWNQQEQKITLQSEKITPPVVTIPGNGNEGNGGNPGNAGNEGSSLKGAWVSSVYNLDWPSSSSYGKKEVQQQEYVKLLDDLQSMGMNAVFVQVRPSADALYPSQLVPWSKFLTGTQGKEPGYDPLAFMVEETHKRGMSFHAWFNPFRATNDANTDKLASNHVVNEHPDWIVTADNKMYINPGIPEARQHIIDTVMEVVNNYNIDGVHLDDYFYPSSGYFKDDDTFIANNSKKIVSKGDWRRDNINQFVQQLGQSIHSVKPQVQFGISPFGVWRNKAVDKTGSDTKAGVTAYDSMYADVRTWIKQEWIDYVTPQIYWSLSFTAARYDTLVDWWVNEVGGTKVKLYIGHSPYKLGTKESGWHSSEEIINQLLYNTRHAAVEGDVFFSAKDLRKNPLGLVQALQAYYRVNLLAEAN
ncbi:family 10 glycosylhydrolase [Paenibacillus eucommiae]|uniref:Uncharacterized lipoprotein YddW (UPF0748 family) n=1 Tax=Paenibacillus eucommiae TaxID=1355755 RepID=A0ABS4IX34_9BACL|nr:family 10 glycosylhydrolase [Paenibacillus eucommiae]MBP1992150.1 uncharacterized lipoprotein YddW (UPF0748 family) [Paenibacillus eucommiae]